ncbi:MAG: putative toxin-antitoxin system toxin component, PIN family [Candidatus Competibacteraceae bacterium]
MRVVLDTNVLVSALLMESSLPTQLITHWRKGRFTLLTAAPQLEELMRVTRYSKIRARLKPALAGRLINTLRKVAILVEALPPVDVSPDPYDNYLLSIASGGTADYLITGDKTDLLALGHYAGTKIVSVREFVTLTRLPP